MATDKGSPDTFERFLSVVGEEIESVLGACLIALYLGGSAANGSFIPGRSDLDFVLIVKQPLDLATKSHLVRTLWKVPPPAQARGVETFVVVADDLAEGRWFDLLVSTHPGEPVSADRGQDPDVMLELAKLVKASRALVGPPAKELIPSFERSALLTAMADNLEASMTGDPETYNVLNAARSLAYMETGQLQSKIEGAERVIAHGHDPGHLERAISVQKGDLPDRPLKFIPTGHPYPAPRRLHGR
jgi:hypothetical protein